MKNETYGIATIKIMGILFATFIVSNVAEMTDLVIGNDIFSSMAFLSLLLFIIVMMAI